MMRRKDSVAVRLYQGTLEGVERTTLVGRERMARRR